MHGLASGFTNKILLAMGGSACALLVDVFPGLQTLLNLVIAGIVIYFLIFAIRYFGLIRGAPWVGDLTMDQTAPAMLDYIAIAFCFLGGLIFAL